MLVSVCTFGKSSKALQTHFDGTYASDEPGPTHHNRHQKSWVDVHSTSLRETLTGLPYM